MCISAVVTWLLGWNTCKTGQKSISVEVTVPMQSKCLLSIYVFTHKIVWLSALVKESAFYSRWWLIERTHTHSCMHSLRHAHTHTHIYTSSATTVRNLRVRNYWVFSTKWDTHATSSTPPPWDNGITAEQETDIGRRRGEEGAMWKIVLWAWHGCIVIDPQEVWIPITNKKEEN